MQSILDVFPAFVRPKPNEIFSSWLVRNAHSHELKVHTFYKLVAPKIEIWNRDIDRYADNNFLSLIADKCDTPLHLAKQTLLTSFEGTIFRKMAKNASTRWISPCGVYHRLRKNKYISYCSSCLRNDRMTPYFRKFWRLTLLNNCCECKQVLRNCCPNCENPICFYRADLGEKQKYPGASLCVCTFCGFDIRESKDLPIAPRDYDNQNWIIATMKDGYFVGDRWISPVETFDVLFLFVSALRGNHPRLSSLQETIFKEVGCERPITFAKSGNAFDLESNINNRNSFINGAIYLLNDWPERILRICSDNNIGLSAFNRFDCREAIPDWLNSVFAKIKMV